MRRLSSLLMLTVPAVGLATPAMEEPPPSPVALEVLPNEQTSEVDLEALRRYIESESNWSELATVRTKHYVAQWPNFWNCWSGGWRNC